MTTQSRWSVFAVLGAASLFWVPGIPTRAAEPRQGSAFETEVRLKDMGVCRTNLHMINEAIQEYRRAYKTVPDRLSDLVPRFLADSEVLICPASRRLGELSEIRAGHLRDELTDPGTAYLYEFRRDPIPKVIGRGSRRSMREWKQLQMGLLGSEVPIVRCWTHGDRRLNLSFGGKVYESGVDWEDNYAHLVVRADLSFTRLFARGDKLRVIPVPPRPPDAPQALVDLSDFYNASLAKSWNTEDPIPVLTQLRAGLQTFNGVRFDVRGVVQLYADAAWLDIHPTNVTGIPVGLLGRRLHFLHGTIGEEARRKLIGNYRIHFENGENRSVPLRYGAQVADWRSDPASLAADGDTQVAWTGKSAVGAAGRKPFVLYQTVWDNPLPHLRIQTLDCASDPGTESGPFLIAVTVEP
jgi:hypothetical protein